MDNCPSSQIIGAVLGTFFGTLLLCGLLLVALFVIYRRRMAQLQIEMARRQSPVSDTKEKKRMTVAPPIVQAYTNAGFHEQETYESQGTLQVRQPEVVQSSAVPIERSVDAVDLKPTSRDETLQLESILQLTLAQCDCVGRGFQVSGGDSDGVSGGVYVSDVMPEASTLLRTVMKSGDEILSINIELTRRLSASNVRDVLRLAADCPVRLTLRGKRRPSSSVPVVHGSDFDDPQLIPTTSRDDGDYGHDNNYHTTSERSSVRRSIAESGTGSAAATEHRSPRLSAVLTRWNSVPINAVEHGPENDEDFTEIEGSHEQVFQTYRGLTVEPLPERASSLTDVKLHDNATRGPVGISLLPAARSAISDGRLYVKCDAINTGNVTDASGLYAKSYSAECDSSDSPGFENITEEDIRHQLEDARHLPDKVSNDNLSTIDVDSYVKISRSDFDDDDNDNLDRALAAGRHQPNRAGLDKALRAKEKESRGGMAYYVDLEQHFDEGTLKQNHQ